MCIRRRSLPARFRLALVAGLVALGGAGPIAAQTSGAAAVTSAGAAQAPFGVRVGERIPFYDRVAPQVGTSGPLEGLGGRKRTPPNSPHSCARRKPPAHGQTKRKSK